MKLLLLLLAVFALFGFNSIAQSSIDEKISEVYGQTFLENCQNNNPAVLRYFENVNSCYSVSPYNSKFSNAGTLENIELHTKPIQTISVDSFLEAYDQGDFNFLRLNMKPSNDTQIYKLGDSGRVLVITNTKFKKQ